MKIYTSEEILAMDELYDIAENTANLIPVKYQLTDGEMGWLDFVRGRYCVADWIDENIDENNVLTIDAFEMSEALFNDNGNWPKATCLSDDTALQKIIFWCFIENLHEQSDY